MLNIFNVCILILKVKRVDDVSTLGIFEPFIEHRSNTFDPSSMLITKQTIHKSANKHDKKETNPSAVKPNIMLHGFYQSWRYFENIESQIRENFKFGKHIVNDVSRFSSGIGKFGRVSPSNDFKSYKSGNLNEYRITRVGIHVRRGDCLSSRSNIVYGYTIADKSYFERAMRHLISKLREETLGSRNGSKLLVEFVVCSDDILWCHKNVVISSLVDLVTTGSTLVSIVYSENGSDSAAVDLGILARCDHVIMSTGTFGWWAGWLAGGHVVYYNDWPRRGSKLDRQVNKMDYFPEHWVPL